MLTNHVPICWFATDVEDLDAEVLQIKKGESSGQSALEAMALLIGLRAWPEVWKDERTFVLTRSDALAALGALLKLSSPAAPVNKVMQEVALDIADGNVDIEVVSHIPGGLNTWADCLSRLNAPEPERKTIPVPLMTVPRTAVGPRGRGWWRTLREMPGDESERSPSTSSAG